MLPDRSSRPHPRRSNSESCPHCGAELQGDPIPVVSQEAYGATHFSRKIAIYDRGVDRTVAFRCPDCSQEWTR